MYAPPPIRFSNKCKRCGLRYPRKAAECVHCNNLTDQQMEAMLLEKRRAHKNTANIGKLFLFITALIVAAMLLASM